MASEYYLSILSPAGVKRGTIVNMLTLAYARRVNAPGLLTFTLAPEQPAIALLELDGQVEVWRRDVAAGIPWYCDFGTLFRGSGYQVDTNGDEVFSAACVGQLHWLSRRVVAYPANMTGYSVIRPSPAEAIMRRIVQTNCTALATVANGRIRDGAIAGIDVEANQNRGKSVPWSGAGKMVLGELQDLARKGVGNGDFDLVKTGPADWVFRFYPGQLGTDRSSGASAVTFARGFDNMAEPHITTDRIEEKTAAIVAGQGAEQARPFVVSTGVGFSATNDIEVFVDGRNAQDTTALQWAGYQALDQAQARAILTFAPLQTPQTRYGKHYFLGDLVRGRYRGLTIVQKVTAATITLTRDGDEQVSIELSTP